MKANMSKNTARWWAVLAVLLVVHSVVAFVLPFAKDTVFILSYVFTLVALGAQIYVIRTAFYQGEGVKSKFYGFPIAKVGAIYLIAQMVLSLVFMALGNKVPVWLPVVIYVVMLGAAVLGFIAVDAARDEVVRQDVKVKKDVSIMRDLQATINALVGQCDAAELKKFAESLRYSDPVSSEALLDVEAELTVCVNQIQQAVTDKNAEEIAAACQKAEIVLAKRNLLCKQSK